MQQPVGLSLSTIIQISRALISFLIVMLVIFGIHLHYSSSNNNSQGFSSQTRIYVPSQEIKNVTNMYPQVNQTTFSCNVPSDCVKIITSVCFNNAPWQQACINKNYYSSYSASRNQTLRKEGVVACPLYEIMGSSTCGCISQECSLVYVST